MKYLLNGRILFALFFVILFAVLVVTSFSYNPRARTFPLLVSVPVLIGALGNLIGDVRRVRRGDKAAKTESAKPTEAHPNKKTDLTGAERTRREFIGIAWLIGYVAAVALIGFPIATVAYMIVFIRFFNHESWKLTLIYTTLLWGFIWVAFVFFLKSNLYEGLIFLWLGQ